jgi:hypothetical protein
MKAQAVCTAASSNQGFSAQGEKEKREAVMEMALHDPAPRVRFTGVGKIQLQPAAGVRIMSKRTAGNFQRDVRS